MIKSIEAITEHAQCRPTPDDVALIYERKWKETVTAGVNNGMTTQDAEDATQNGVIRAIVGLDTYAGTAPLDHWYSATVFKTRVDYYRGGRVKREREIIGGDDEISAKVLRNKEYPAFVPSHEESVINSDDWKRIHEAIVGLQDEAQREAVILFAQGLSYDEMSTVLGVPKGTVKSRVSRGMKKVRSVFFEESSSE